MLSFHILMCVVVAICTVNWNNKNRKSAFYLQLLEENDLKRGVLAFFQTVSLNSTFIPIALLVAIELVKLTQAWFIEIDTELMIVTDACKL